MVWVYATVAAFIQILDAIVLIPIRLELLGERSRYQRGVKKWDQLLSRIMATMVPMTIWILSGFDYRYTWSPKFPDWLVILCVGMVFMGGLLAPWTMASNRFSLVWFETKHYGVTLLLNLASINRFGILATWIPCYSSSSLR